MNLNTIAIILVANMFLVGCVQVAEQAKVQEPIVSSPNEKSSSVETSYGMNEKVAVDYLAYQVTKVQTFQEMGTTIYHKETEGKFVKVYVKITNNAKETKELFSPRLYIQDAEERIFERLSDDYLYIADHIEFGKQLQPGLAVTGAVVFEMPADARDLTLLIKGDLLSLSVAKVHLTGIEDIGKDTTQQDEQDKKFDAMMDESQQKVEEMMKQCNAPFKCTNSCAQYSDVGQKDCASGQVCCMDS